MTSEKFKLCRNHLAHNFLNKNVIYTEFYKPKNGYCHVKCHYNKN